MLRVTTLLGEVILPYDCLVTLHIGRTTLGSNLFAVNYLVNGRLTLP